MKDQYNIFAKGYSKINKPSEEILELLNTQNIIKWNDGTEMYQIPSIFIKDKEDNWMMFSSEKEYIVYLKHKSK